MLFVDEMGSAEKSDVEARLPFWAQSSHSLPDLNVFFKVSSLLALFATAALQWQ